MVQTNLRTLVSSMLLSVYSHSDNEAARDQAPAEERVVLNAADGDRLDQQVYSARAALIQSEPVLSEKMAAFHMQTIQYLMQAGEGVANADLSNANFAQVADGYEAALTQLQNELMQATAFQRDASGSYSKAQEVLAYNTYATFFRAVVTLWRCIFSAALQAGSEVDRLREQAIAQALLNKQVDASSEQEREKLLDLYHDRVMQCVHSVEALRKKHMAAVWHGHGPHSIPLPLHIRMFKTYLVELRAFLDAQPALTLHP